MVQSSLQGSILYNLIHLSHTTIATSAREDSRITAVTSERDSRVSPEMLSENRGNNQVRSTTRSLNNNVSSRERPGSNLARWERLSFESAHSMKNASIDVTSNSNEIHSPNILQGSDEQNIVYGDIGAESSVPKPVNKPMLEPWHKATRASLPRRILARTKLIVITWKTEACCLLMKLVRKIERVKKE